MLRTKIFKSSDKKHPVLKLLVLCVLMFIPIILALAGCIMCIPLLLMYLVYQTIRITFLALLNWSLSDDITLKEEFRKGFAQLKHHWNSGTWE